MQNMLKFFVQAVEACFEDGGCRRQHRVGKHRNAGQLESIFSCTVKMQGFCFTNDFS